MENKMIRTLLTEGISVESRVLKFEFLENLKSQYKLANNWH